jgi:uncharacterized membrane protein
MKKRSEGVRRIVQLISVLAVISWISFVGWSSKGFKGFNFDDLFWVFFIGVAIFAFFIPQLISIICYWVLDGFKKDKESQ